jgi:hypothetical protein
VKISLQYALVDFCGICVFFLEVQKCASEHFYANISCFLFADQTEGTLFSLAEKAQDGELDIGSPCNLMLSRD